MLSYFSHIRFLVTLWTIAHQAPLSMGILQARILEWGAISYSRGSSWPRDQTHVLWEDLEGAGGEGGGRGDRDGEDMWTQGLFISMYDKIHYKKKKTTKHTSLAFPALADGFFTTTGTWEVLVLKPWHLWSMSIWHYSPKVWKQQKLCPYLEFSKVLGQIQVESKHNSFRVNGSDFPIIFFALALVVYIQ